MMYSDKVMEHFSNPRNVGALKDADGVGEVGNPVCGDMMTFYIKVKDDRLSEVKFQTFGCGAAIAVSSMVSEMATGKRLDEAMQITNQDVADELGGLPGNKMHCSNLGADALHKAIEDFRDHKEKVVPKAAAEPKVKKDTDTCCPYCEGPVEGLEAVCGTCHVELGSCDECGEPTNKKGDKCPHCGATTVRV
jgi:nitrogen fixation NifU-like protein